jgi:hypothetical protein
MHSAEAPCRVDFEDDDLVLSQVAQLSQEYRLLIGEWHQERENEAELSTQRSRQIHIRFIDDDRTIRDRAIRRTHAFPGITTYDMCALLVS